MPEEKKQSGIWLLLLGTVILLAVVIAWSVKKQNAVEPSVSEPVIIEHNHDHSGHDHSGHDHSTPENVADANRSLSEIVKDAWTWGPEFHSWHGKLAPDITITDIKGKVHKLSDYRGKDVMLVFWATWCGPCKMEIPHLIALRKTISPEKLAILAISYEPAAVVKGFISNSPLNYDVFAVNANNMPRPFNIVNSIPCSFFINPEGKIKIATIGTLSLGDMKAIIEAEK